MHVGSVGVVHSSANVAVAVLSDVISTQHTSVSPLQSPTHPRNACVDPSQLAVSAVVAPSKWTTVPDELTSPPLVASAVSAYVIRSNATLAVLLASIVSTHAVSVAVVPAQSPPHDATPIPEPSTASTRTCRPLR